MKLELLHIAGCPNTDAALRLLEKTARELGYVAEIAEIEVSNSAEAQVLTFPGSPTIRVNGIDVESSRLRQRSYGLSCRMYMVNGTLRGLPTQRMIRQAIESALTGKTEVKRS